MMSFPLLRCLFLGNGDCIWVANSVHVHVIVGCYDRQDVHVHVHGMGS